MKESEFIEQNKKKWLDFENNLLKKDADPSATSKLFVQITDDLSYARTFYKNRSVRLYLNGVAKLLFNDLNKSQKKGTGAFVDFWKKDLPLTMYKSRRAMLISFLVFVGCFILGVITSIQDKEFARSILSNDYVNMTSENIAKGDPMAVYKSESEVRTFLPILFNNLRVDFLTFFSGIFMAIGTLVVMVVNGVMVGVFQYYFIERGLFWESFLTIWTHGALEISAIILSGGAGLTLGKGLLFPGTHTRLQAFKLSGMNGLKIIMGVAPITLLAAFIEGFLTRHTTIPDLIRLAFILLSFAFILIYFFFYPRRVATQTAGEPTVPEKTLIYKPAIKFDQSEIYSPIKIVTESFRLLFTHFVFFGKYIFSAALMCSIFIAVNPLNLFHAYDSFFFSLGDLFNYTNFPSLAILTAICFIVMILAGFNYLQKIVAPEAENISESKSRRLFRAGFSTLIVISLFVLIILTDIDFILAAAQTFLPFFIFVSCVSYFHNIPFSRAFNYAGVLIFQSWSRFLVTAIVLAVFSLLVYFTTTYGLKSLLIKDALIWALTDDELVAEKIAMGLIAFQTFISLFVYLALLIISGSILFFTLNEIYTARYLISKIKNISVSK